MLMRYYYLIIACLVATPSLASAKDYFLTIGGGYSPQGNQASLEANVLFFRDVISEQHRTARSSATFFADGYNERADLQVLKPKGAKSNTPATDLLAGLYTFRRPRPAVEYRNHQVDNLAGPISPENIKSSLRRQASSMTTGDRLIIYVTAHGGSAKGSNKYNTTISCWDKQAISAKQFEDWLSWVPEDVPVIMVMAQCYCGGFAHTIFESANAQNDLATHLRVGFFAQQHDLAAAGCRPDIDNDEEYSSFFWGAFAGRSRTGKPVTSADLNDDGQISFAEAHAHAVLASETIDIPITTSEALLRRFSRIPGYDHRRDQSDDDDDSDSDQALEELLAGQGTLREMQGTLATLTDSASGIQKRIVTNLVDQLGMQMSDDVVTVFEKFTDQRDETRTARRSGSRRSRGRSSSGRRELRAAIADEWPELGDRDNWRKSDLLSTENQAELFDSITRLESYRRYKQLSDQRQSATDRAREAELKEVKFQRLVNTLEAIVLAENLPSVASQEVVDHFHAMLAIEASYLSAP